jgi:hypothetical protein
LLGSQVEVARGKTAAVTSPRRPPSTPPKRVGQEETDAALWPMHLVTDCCAERGSRTKIRTSYLYTA